MPKKTLSEFIKEANTKHNNFYDYSKTVYVNNKTKVCVIDPIYGEFWVTPNHHLTNLSGHPQRAIDYRNKLNTLTQCDVLKKFIEVHGDIYDYSQVKYKNMQTKVFVIHPIHGGWWIKPYSHIQGHGHPSINPQNYDPTKPGYLYIHKIDYDNKIYYKFGITNNYEKRFTALKYNSDTLISKYKVFYSINGFDIQNIESEIKKDKNIKTSALNKDVFRTGYTETVLDTELSKIINIINKHSLTIVI